MGKKPLSILETDDRMTQMQVECNLEKDWMGDGICFKDQDLHALFFSYESVDVDMAREVCKQCPVRKLCYSYAVIYAEQGVWGDSTTQERKDRRPFIVDDVLELWPRLYRRWADGSEEVQGPPLAQSNGRAPDSVMGSPPAPPTEQEAERERVRRRAIELPGDHVFYRGSRNPGRLLPEGVE